MGLLLLLGVYAADAAIPTGVTYEAFYDQTKISFDQPTHVGGVPNQPERLVVMERAGATFLLEKQGAQYVKKAWFSVDANTETHWDGAWKVEFHPRFDENRKFYVLYRRKDLKTRSVIEEWQAPASGLENPQRVRTIIEFEQKTVHSSGDIIFGADGYLYSAQADRQFDAQDMQGLWGKVIRIDIDKKDPGLEYAIPQDNPFRNKTGIRPEIWASGFRVPWRFNFDPKNGDLWLGDVGHLKNEEINLVNKGLNYGASIVEGNCETGNCSQLVNPVVALTRAQSACVIGGFVYRADPASAFYGVYLFGDYETRKIYGLILNDDKTTVKEMKSVAGNMPGRISAFGQDASGLIYAAMYTEHGTVQQRQTHIFRLKHAELKPAVTTGLKSIAQSGKSTRTFTGRDAPAASLYTLDGRKVEVSETLNNPPRGLLLYADRETGELRKWVPLH